MRRRVDGEKHDEDGDINNDDDIDNDKGARKSGTGGR